MISVAACTNWLLDLRVGTNAGVLSCMHASVLQVVVRNGIPIEAIVPDYSELDYGPGAQHASSRSMPGQLPLDPKSSSNSIWAANGNKNTAVRLQALKARYMLHRFIQNWQNVPQAYDELKMRLKTSWPSRTMYETGRVEP